MKRLLTGLFMAALAQLLVTSAQAQATRTWVSGVGDDANPCSRTAPCKTFAGAISKTAASGEISVLDPGGFGAVTITKSISIVSRGFEGGVLATIGATGIIINAAATDQIYLEGLTIEGVGTGGNGVRFIAGGVVTINNCVIRGFRNAGTGIGIDYQASTADSKLNVNNTLIEANLTGIRVKAAAGATNSAILSRVIIGKNQTAGITVEGAASFVTLMDSVVSGAINKVSGGNVFSFGNNALFSGSPSQAVPLQ